MKLPERIEIAQQKCCVFKMPWNKLPVPVAVRAAVVIECFILYHFLVTVI